MERTRAAVCLRLAGARGQRGHGKTPAGAELTLVKQFSTVTSPVVSPTGEISDARAFTDRLESSLVVGDNGRFSWHVNPSTRPAVMAKRLEVLGDPLQSETFEGGPTAPVVGSVDHVFTAAQPGALMQVDLTWPTPDDMDLEVYFREADGSLRQVASSGSFVDEKEQAVVEAPAAGEYVLRVINFASATPSYTVTAAVYGTPEYETTPELVEQWTLVCSIGGQEVARQLVTVDRGQQVKVTPCGAKR